MLSRITSINFLSLIILAASCTTASAAGWQAGVAKRCITPEKPMPMAGYASRGTNPATGKFNDLWAKALVLQDAKGQSSVLITLDLCGVDRLLADQISEAIRTTSGFERQQIWLACSHTHSGPVVAGNLRPLHYLSLQEQDRQLVDSYARFLIETIAQIVTEAKQSMKPCDVSYSQSTATFAVNRRNNPANEVPDRRAAGTLVGPSDHDVPILAVRRDKQFVALVFGYACHNTTLSGMEWCGDYAGFAQDELEAKYPNCVAMFWSGCGGDQNPLPRGNVAQAKEYGSQLANAVTSGCEQLKAVAPELKIQFATIPLPFADLPTREQLTLDQKSDNQYTASRAQILLAQLDEDKSLPKTYDYPIATWKLGNEVNWISLGGEVVVDYALETKALQNKIADNAANKPDETPRSWVMAYAHDVMAYIPSQRVLREGGYEGGGAMVYYGLPTIWDAEIENLILAEIRRQLSQ